MAPRTLDLPLTIHVTMVHVSPAAAVARKVFVNASAASPFAASALPALNPNHPNQRRAAPSTTSGTFSGSMTDPLNPCLGRSTSADASAAVPAAMWTTVPPAKSSMPIVCSHPSTPQTQCATGA